MAERGDYAHDVIIAALERLGLPFQDVSPAFEGEQETFLIVARSGGKKEGSAGEQEVSLLTLPGSIVQITGTISFPASTLNSKLAGKALGAARKRFPEIRAAWRPERNAVDVEMEVPLARMRDPSFAQARLDRLLQLGALVRGAVLGSKVSR